MNVRVQARGWKRLATVLLGTILVAGLSAGCSMKKERTTTTELPTELRVGVTPNYPPLATKQDGKLAGVEIDFANLLAKQLNIKVTFVELPWEELIPALVDNKIDVIMSGMSITPARTQYIDFTVPYMPVGQMALVRKIELPHLREQSAMDQPKSRVGVLQNTTGDYYARRTLKQAQVLGFVTVDEAIVALRSGRIDFFLSDAPTIWDITGSNRPENADLGGIYRRLTLEYLAWGVRQNDDALRRQLNTTILMWAQNGQLEDIVDDWVRTRRVTLPATK